MNPAAILCLLKLNKDCKLAFTTQTITAANLEFLKNRDLLTTKDESEVGQQELSKLSNLFNEVFQGNTTAVPSLFDAFNTITKSLSTSVNQTR